MDPLIKILKENDVRFLLMEVRIRKGQFQLQEIRGEPVPSLWEPVLDIVEHVCRLILCPSFDGNASEAEVVSEWKAVFNFLLNGSGIYMRSGECVSDSSKDIKDILDEEFDDFGTFGRKVDLIFHANGQELTNCEFKVAEATELDIELQNRKKHPTQPGNHGEP
ncbi:hypothetical protein EDD21DRAFT_406580 [Dissophora ornata]|nr:hypothetical protein EDD21DRAFT_406580 [Dissophora ornata]